MADLDLVEKLRARADVTYDEAKEALEACGDDLLDAVIYLERKGKVPPPSGGGQYTSRDSQEGAREYAAYRARHKEGKTFSEHMRTAGEKLDELLKKSWAYRFAALRDTEIAFQIPLLIFLLLLCGSFWVVVPLMILGLFIGFRYRVEAPASTADKSPANTRINEIIDEVANVADAMKSETIMNTNTKKDE